MGSNPAIPTRYAPVVQWLVQLPCKHQTAVRFNPGAPAIIAGWSSLVAREVHTLEVASSNLAPATKEIMFDLVGQLCELYKSKQSYS